MGSPQEQIEKANRLATISQQLGFALWQLQELEGCTAQYYVLVTKLSPGMDKAAAETLVRDVQRKTFGRTISSLADAGLLPSDVKQRFKKLLAERNWLVHASRSTSRTAVHSDAAALKLIDRVEAIADEAGALLKEVLRLVEAHVRKYGVKPQDIEVATAQLLEEWQHGEE